MNIPPHRRLFVKLLDVGHELVAIRNLNQLYSKRIQRFLSGTNSTATPLESTWSRWSVYKTWGTRRTSGGPAWRHLCMNARTLYYRLGRWLVKWQPLFTPLECSRPFSSPWKNAVDHCHQPRSSAAAVSARSHWLDSVPVRLSSIAISAGVLSQNAPCSFTLIRPRGIVLVLFVSPGLVPGMSLCTASKVTFVKVNVGQCTFLWQISLNYLLKLYINHLVKIKQCKSCFKVLKYVTVI